ncbi:MAG: hypothetical protein ACPG5U_00605 [Planktomarina sp.]
MKSDSGVILKIRFLGILLTSYAVLAGCTQPPNARADLERQIVQMGCAISFAAIRNMGSNGVLADPKMVAGCRPEFSGIDVDIRPLQNFKIPTTGVAAQLYQSLLQRRMPTAVANDIIGSPAFARWITIGEHLKQLPQ